MMMAGSSSFSSTPGGPTGGGRRRSEGKRVAGRGSGGQSTMSDAFLSRCGGAWGGASVAAMQQGCTQCI